MDLSLLTTCAVGGVAWGAGFAAGFKAAGKKEQEADVFAAPQVELLPVCLHVLPGKVCELVGAGVDACGEDGFHVDGCGADDSGRGEDFGKWCVGVKVSIRLVVKEGEECVVLAAGCLEDAFYFFLCQVVKPSEAQGLFYDSVKGCYEVNKEACGGKDAEDVYPVHVFVAVCPQLDELRRKAGREVKKEACYADGGCELFVGKDFFKFLEDGEPGGFHGDSVTVLG